MSIFKHARMTAITCVKVHPVRLPIPALHLLPSTLQSTGRRSGGCGCNGAVLSGDSGAGIGLRFALTLELYELRFENVKRAGNSSHGGGEIRAAADERHPDKHYRKVCGMKKVSGD